MSEDRIEKLFTDKNFSEYKRPFLGDDWTKQVFEDDAVDMVNSPAHYTTGRYEAIDIIEDAIAEAPTPMAGMCQGNALKYLLRLWHKIDAKEDAEKAKWYLNKLIELLD